MTSPLPVLREPLRKRFSACAGKRTCRGCPLHEAAGGPCGGCDREVRERCLQRYCYSRCNICGGGLHATVPAVCGRSPLRHGWAELITAPLEPFAALPVAVRSPLIPVLYGQRSARAVPRAFPGVDAWAVPVHKAMDRSGRFRSADMKDFLGLGPHQSLILSTAGPDDFMEVLWERGEALDFAAHGFDAWFPAHFSVYDRESRFQQLFNARRQQIHARRVGSHFVWFRLGECVPLHWLDLTGRCPSVLISSQQMFSQESRRWLRDELRTADELFPDSTAFFLLGSGLGVPLRPSRRVHELHAGWLIRGLKGRDMSRRPRPDLRRNELLELNLRWQLREVERRRGPRAAPPDGPPEVGGP